MIIKKKIYQIALFEMNDSGSEAIIADFSYDINKRLMEVKVDQANPVDFYDFSGEPRKASVKLGFKNSLELLVARSVFKATTRLLEDQHIVYFDVDDEVDKIHGIFSEAPNSPNVVTFPGWYSQQSGNNDVFMPPTLEEGEEITGNYLDFDDIYIRKKSKFMNIYVKIYHIYPGESLTEDKRIFTGILERESVKINHSTLEIDLEFHDGLAILYDSLEAYEGYCTFCQDEDDYGLAIKSSGVTMQDFQAKVMPLLTQFPYKTLFNYIPYCDTPANAETVQFDHESDYLAVNSGLVSGHNYIFPNPPDFHSAWITCDIANNKAYIIFYYTKSTGTTVGWIACRFVVGYEIDIDTSSGDLIFDFSTMSKSSIFELGSTPSGETHIFSPLYTGFYDLFGVNYNSIWHYYEIVPGVNLLSLCELYDFTFVLKVQSILHPSINVYNGNVMPEDDLYRLCVSFNTEVAPMDVVRLILLTTGSCLQANGYNIKLNPINAIIENAPIDATLDANKFKKGTTKEETVIEEPYKFDEIESVTLWKNSDPASNDGKALKPKLKKKLSFLMETKNRYEIEVPLSESLPQVQNIKWGSLIKITNFPESQNDKYFVYNIDKEDDFLKLKIFRLEN